MIAACCVRGDYAPDPFGDPTVIAIEPHRAQACRPGSPTPHLALDTMPRDSQEFTLDPPDAERLANLAGPFDAHLRMLELRLGVEIANRGNVFRVSGPPHRPRRPRD